ncbi:MAG: hypothetical protein HYW23_00095 [Candidatus Aenigmarchaeota archaeon]|nr:hypothetical protein [Candidatus Aenigmarchaeota archaeon]
MPTWILEDDCLTPERIIRIDFKGVNPFRVYYRMSEFLKFIFDVRGKDVYEKEFRWDFTSDPRDFLSRFIVKKKYDEWTNAWIEAKLQGKQPADSNKDGEVTILLTGKLQTKSPERTVMQRSTLYKSLRWLYFRTLYNDLRRNYIEECRIKINDLKRTLEKTLGISPEVVLK